MKNGIYANLSNEDYQADPAISRSAIMSYLDSPFKYYANYINPDRPKKEPTRQMIIGSAFHTAILEIDKFFDEYTILPPKVLLKDVGKEQYENYKLFTHLAEESKKIILTRDEMDLITLMRDVLIKHPQAWDLIKDGVYESSYFWEDEHSELMCKCRPDILHSNIIVDLKTCNDASPRAFQNDMARYGNYLQGAMIIEGIKQLRGMEIKKVINICIEKTYPYAIGIYIIDEAALDHGHLQFKNALLSIKDGIKNNDFPDYGIQEIGLPKWAL